MGGVGVFAWLAIGIAGGWVTSRLMTGADDDDALRGTAAGMVGGILGGLGMRLLEGDRDVTDARIVTRFDTAVYPSLGDRMQTLAAWLRAG